MFSGLLTRARALANRLIGSLWFLPSLLVIASIVLAVLMIWLDSRVTRDVLVNYPRLFGATAGSSRSMLSAIAGSMITVAGVTFSITIVAVAQASSQYTSRILRNFMADRANQVVLGVFVGIFTYCLIVIRTIRGEEDLLFIPAISTLVAFLLAIVGIGLLIFFIHHIAESLQAGNILARVADETIESVDRLFPADLGKEADEAPAIEQDDHEWVAVPVLRCGYIQSVNTEQLLRIAEKHEVLLRMEREIGEFVVEGTALVSVAGALEKPESLAKAINDVYVIMSYRTVHQDVAFGVRQLVDVALKALSPGINDTTTAIGAIDYLSTVLARLASRRIESRVRRDGEKPRIIARGPSFESLMNDALDEIRVHGAGNASVFGRMLHALETVGQFARDEGRRRCIREHVQRVSEAVERSIDDPESRQDLLARALRVQQKLVRPQGS